LKPAFAERYNKQTPGSGFFRISDLRSRISDLGSRISDPGSQISDPGSPKSDLGFPDLGSQISDPGSLNHIFERLVTNFIELKVLYFLVNWLKCFPFSTSGRFKPAFVERNKKQTMIDL
jgi:hypothetical protein